MSNSHTAPVIAIDGPSASGKGTIAQRVAAALGFHYLESGALYRALSLVSLREGIQAESRLAGLAATLDLRFQGGRIFEQNHDLTDDLRREDVGNRASEIAKMATVRKALLGRQRRFREPPGLVADGRDMGTVVFPDATLKVFLTASPEVRAQRRHKQLKDKGITANLAALSRDLQERDERDTSRAVAPLTPAPDSQVLDSSTLSIEAVAGRILELYRELTEPRRA